MDARSPSESTNKEEAPDRRAEGPALRGVESGASSTVRSEHKNTLCSQMTRIESGSSQWGWRSSAYAWWVVVVLAVGLTISLADRVIMVLMTGPLKHDLHLSDTEIGLLQGLAFTIFYVLAGLPLGRMADTTNRRTLAATCVVAWSLATAGCAACSSFSTLFAARLLVGVGEAGLAPAAVSLISDYFPPQLRARPLAFLTIGAFAGVGLSFMFGGSIIHAFGAAKFVDVPGFGQVQGWQAVFLSLGAIGVLFSAVFAFVREPPRHERVLTADASLSAVLRFFWGARRFLTAQILGTSLAGVVLTGLISWMPTLLSRRFGWSAGRTGIVYGACIAVGACAAVIIAGWLTVYLVRRGVKNATQIVCFSATAAAIAPLALGPLFPTPLLVLVSVSLGTSMLQIPGLLAAAALQQVCPNEFRAQVFAVYLAVASTFSFVIGPLAVPIITDAVLHNEMKVNLSLALVAAFFVPLAAIAFRLAMRFAPAESSSTPA